MRPIRTLVTVVFIAVIAITGCSAHTNADQPSPTPNPLDQQAPIYAAVLRQYLTSGGGHHGGDARYGGFRFPRIFVLDHAAAGVGGPSWQTAAGGVPISPAVRRSIIQALADAGPVTFVPSPDAVVDHHGCAQVRTRGILITLGPVDGVGDQVQVGIYGLSPVLLPTR
jgi:hypothetical protein